MIWSVGVALAEEPVGPEPAPPAPADTVSVTFTDDFELRYWAVDQRLADPADVAVFNYVEQVDRLNVYVTSGPWNAKLQLDEVLLAANRYYLDDELYVERDLLNPEVFTPFPAGTSLYVNPEKVQVGTERSWGSVVLGDAYVAFGRGTALNLNRNVDIDIDTSVQGAKALLRPGAWDVTLVAGTANRQQVFQDNPNIGLLPDYRHRIAGVRAERFGLGPFNLGAHGVWYDFVREPGFESLAGTPEADTLVGGLTAEFVGIGGFDGYVEYDAFGYGGDLALEDAPALGHGLYASTSAYPGRFVVLAEFKRYVGVERVNSLLTPELYEVAIAPTLEYERIVLEDTAASLNSNDIWGGRVQVDMALVPGKVAPYVSVATHRDLDLGGLHFNTVPETIVHPMTGVEWIDGEFGLLLNGGYRHEDRDGSEFGADQLAHVDLSLNFPLPGDFVGYVSGATRRFWWGINELQQADFSDGESAYTLTWAKKVSLTGSLDWTANPLVTSTGNISETLYTAVEAQWKPQKAWTLKAFYGAQKAGIRCSGGQCRTLPGFEGGRISAVGTF